MSKNADFDIYSAAQIKNPYPLYESARKSNPIFWNERLGSWIFTDYESVKFLLEGRVFSAERTSALFSGLPPGKIAELSGLRSEFSNWIMMKDQPAQGRMRGSLSAAMSATGSGKRLTEMNRILEGLLHDALSKGTFEVITALAYPFPLIFVASLIGLPQDRYQWLREKSRDLALSFGIGRRPERAFEIACQGQQAAIELKNHLSEVLAEKSKRPGNDLLSFFAQRPDCRPI